MKSDEISLKEKRLLALINACGRSAVAFSGGVDSAYLLYMAVLALGVENVLAVTVSSALQPAAETKEAKAIADNLGIEQFILPLDLLEIDDVVKNSAERCYYCKNALFKSIITAAGKRGFKVVLDGTNADDPGDYRPGLRALKELGIISPLLKAALSKEEIRFLSKQAGLPTWNKPAAPCLATRFPTGELINAARLEMVDAAESFLREINVKGNLRVRAHGQIARIEADPAEMRVILDKREIVTGQFKKIGFDYVVIDLSGYRTGSMKLIKS
jgi:pyridinium-3,5-biscarboxylic acid mononucleotide sulfurtransferase